MQRASRREAPKRAERLWFFKKWISKLTSGNSVAVTSLVCATCRKLIPPGTSAIRCTVASCNTGRMKLRFCSVSCWQKHVPTARHRKASYVIEGESQP